MNSLGAAVKASAKTSQAFDRSQTQAGVREQDATVEMTGRKAPEQKPPGRLADRMMPRCHYQVRPSIQRHITLAKARAIAKQGS